MSEQLENAALMEQVQKLKEMYDNFTKAVQDLGNKAKGRASSKFGNTFAHWIAGGLIRTDREVLCEEFLEQVERHLEFLQTCLQEVPAEEASQVWGAVADVILEPIPTHSNATTDLMKRAMRSKLKIMLPYLTPERLELASQQLQEGYRKRELLPVERELLKEIDRRLGKRK